MLLLIEAKELNRNKPQNMFHSLCHRWLAQIMQKNCIFQAGAAKAHMHPGEKKQQTGYFNCEG